MIDRHVLRGHAHANVRLVAWCKIEQGHPRTVEHYSLANPKQVQPEVGGPACWLGGGG